MCIRDSIDIECNFDLRDSTWSRRNSIQPELSERLVVSCELSLSLYNIDINCCLIICSCGEMCIRDSVNMKDRIQSLKGNIQIQTDKGFKIFITIPKEI